MLNLKMLAELAARHSRRLDLPVAEFAIGGRLFPWNRQSAIMGVINLSPDSWYRESVCLTPASAIRRGRVLAEQGAALIDIGAESTLAHAARAGSAVQQSKLLPIVRALAEAGHLVSVETYQPEVAEAALAAGAKAINLTGAERAAEIFRLCQQADAAMIVCYVAAKNAREAGDYPLSGDPMGAMMGSFSELIGQARQVGAQKLILDPGLGFYYRNLQDSAARVRHQMRVFLETFRLRELGYPVCHALPHAFEFFGEEVRAAEPFFAVLAALGQTSLFRTHEVPKVRAVLEAMELDPWNPA